MAPTLTFTRVPEGKTVKNRLHLDINPTDREQDEEVRRLLDLGTRYADVGQGDESWVVLADPEGTISPTPLTRSVGGDPGDAAPGPSVACANVSA